MEFCTDIGNYVHTLRSGYEIDDFMAGKVAMQITGSWTLAQLKSTKIDYGVFPIPVPKQPAAVIGGENLFVFKTTSAREKASLEFLEYVLSEEFQTTWALKTGYLPVNIKSQQSQAYQDFVAANPVIQVFLDQMQWAKSRPIIPQYNRLSENLGRAIEAAFIRQTNPTRGIKAIAAAFRVGFWRFLNANKFSSYS